MNVLLHNPAHVRPLFEGLEAALSFDQVAAAAGTPLHVTDGQGAVQTVQDSLEISDPHFTSFARATNGQLGAAFQVWAASKDRARTFVQFMHYSRENALTAKGYYRDWLTEARKTHPHTASLHMPFEVMGVPMVGSVLALVASRDTFEFESGMLVTNFPAQAFPGMVRHALRGNTRGGVHPGTGDLYGMVDSTNVLLPPLVFWQGQSILAEYRDGSTLSTGRMRPDDIGRLFGVSPQPFNETLALCTPPALIQTFLKTFTQVTSY